MINRDEYLNWLIGFKDKELIKVITGIRRCGKSTIMGMYISYLLRNGVEQNQIISINFEDFDFADLKDSKKLHDYVMERKLSDKTTYVFLDEIQNVIEFPLVLDSLFIKDKIDIYVTGSNAYMLSSEIATVLSGRYVSLKMLPLSFAEFHNGTNPEKPLFENYTKYLESSSFPYILSLQGQPKEINEYLNGIYSTVILKDVIGRYKIADSMMLESIVSFIFHNIGSRLSTKKISNTMSSSGRNIDTKTVEKYISALMDSFIIYQAKRFDIKGKQYLKTLEKYYVVDIGMRFMLLGRKNADVGHILENVIYLELIRRGYRVFIGKFEEFEVDFIAEKFGEIIYLQVAASVRETLTLERELLSLQKIKDNYPKLLLTLDEDPDADYDGIKRTNALKWLMENKYV